MVTKSEYAQNPGSCIKCQQIIPWEKRRNKYCSHSCSASETNTFRQVAFNPNWHKQTYQCTFCNADTKYEQFCSRACRSAYSDKLFQDGKLSSRQVLREHVSKRDGFKCVQCSTSEWREVPLPLELDHIDGDASNNKPCNLRLLCPNCHSVTPTWKARNKGSGRKSRGMGVH